MKSSNIWALFVVVLLAISCDKNRVFEEFYKINEKGWQQDSLVSFTFEVQDPTISYNLSLDVRNTANYKYCNLYVRYYLYDAKGTKLKTDMPEVFLMDPKTGKPLGDGTGGSFTHTFDLMKNYKFPQKGIYKIKFKQYMREANLEEIKNIGFRLEKFSVKK